MPPPNRLAPPLQNSLAYSVPAPLEPGMLPPPPSRFVPRRELENLSIGLGRGVRSGMEGTAQLLTQPIATAQALIEAARQLGTDPRIVLDMLRAARQKAMSGSLGLGELIGENVTPGFRGRRVPTMRELDVYQGSRHRFEPTPNNPFGEFDASKIGTGEGAQAYGYGSYLAESPLVAKGYMRAGGGWPAVFINGKQVFGSENYTPDAGDFLEVTGKEFGEISGAKAKELALRHVPADIRQQYKDVPDSAFTVSRSEGHLYKADLPDEMIDRMLDFDKPFFDQSQEIKNLAKSMLPLRVYDRVLMERTGDFIEALGVYNGGNAKAAKLLQQAGIPGIKYLDAGSRGQGGAGTRNFVVFPGEEKKVRILERK